MGASTDKVYLVGQIGDYYYIEDRDNCQTRPLTQAEIERDIFKCPVSSNDKLFCISERPKPAQFDYNEWRNGIKKCLAFKCAETDNFGELYIRLQPVVELAKIDKSYSRFFKRLFGELNLTDQFRVFVTLALNRDPTFIDGDQFNTLDKIFSSVSFITPTEEGLDKWMLNESSEPNDYKAVFSLFGGQKTYTAPKTDLVYSIYKNIQDFIGYGQFQILVKGPEEEMPDPLKAITFELRRKIEKMSPFDQDMVKAFDAFGNDEINTNIQIAYALAEQLKTFPNIKDAHIDPAEYQEPLGMPIVVQFQDSFQLLDFVQKENLDIREYLDGYLEPSGIYGCGTQLRYATNHSALFDLACDHVWSDYSGVTKNSVTDEWIPY